MSEEIVFTGLRGDGRPHLPARGREPQALPSTSHFDPTACRSHRHRLQAPAAGAQEPALQRLQIHRAGRRAADDVGASRAAGARDHPVSQAPVGDRLRGLGHRHRHPAGETTASSSRPSSRPTPAPAASTAAPAWASPSAASSPTCSAARSSSQHVRARAAPSRSTCRQTYVGRRPVRLRAADRPLAARRAAASWPLARSRHADEHVDDDRDIFSRAISCC